MNKLTFLLVTALASSCSSEFDPTNPGSMISTARHYKYVAKSDALLIVVQNPLPEKQERHIRLYIDGVPAADFLPGETGHFGLTIGTHNLTTQTLTKCKIQNTSNTKIHVKAGDTLVTRIIGGAINSQPTN